MCSVGGKKEAASPEPSSAGEPSLRAAGPLGPLPSFVPEPLRSTPQISAAWDSAHIVIPVGCATGFASGAFGIGGGVVMTAALGTACGMAQVEAVATSLCAIVPTGLAYGRLFSIWRAVLSLAHPESECRGTFHNMRRGAVDKKAALAIGVASMVATGATATYVTAAVPDKELRTRHPPHSRSQTARDLWTGQKD